MQLAIVTGQPALLSDDIEDGRRQLRAEIVSIGTIRVWQLPFGRESAAFSLLLPGRRAQQAVVVELANNVDKRAAATRFGGP